MNGPLTDIIIPESWDLQLRARLVFHAPGDVRPAAILLLIDGGVGDEDDEVANCFPPSQVIHLFESVWFRVRTNLT